MIARPLYWLLPLVALMASPCLAQSVDSTSRALKPADSAAAVQSGYVMTKNPLTATLLSIAPGLGQWYNQQYWKVPIFAGAAGFFVYRAISFNNLYLQKAAEARAYPQNSSQYATLKFQRESYRDDRDLNIAYFVGVEIVSMIDAYVGAHLFDFDVGDDLSSKIYFDPAGRALGLSVRF